MSDAMLITAARSFSAALGSRWDGWHVVGVGRDPNGAGVIHLSFDKDHVPALRVASHYQDYPVHLHPGTRPTA
jgi:hypothetical protein